MIKIRKKLPIIRFPSSLIQQNHAESLMGHGYTLWDLKSKTYSHIDIPNDYGFFSIFIENGVMMTDLKDLPKKARIRFQLKNTTASEIKEALTKVRQLTDVVEVSYQKLDAGKSLTRIPSATGNVVLGDISDKNYQTTLLTDYLKTKLGVTEQSVIDGVIKINDEVNDVVKKDDFARNIRWKPIKLEFSNMFGYGNDNIIDFTKIKDLVGLFSSN